MIGSCNLRVKLRIRFSVRKTLLLSLLLLATVAAAQTKRPVLVELFTSEGCSSCPPADQLLFQLERQPVPDAEVIVLGEHVDYWDQLGWLDRFSSRAFTVRQQHYAERFGGDSYTPQMVINGRVEFVGNDSEKALRSIAQQAKSAEPTEVHLVLNGDHLHITVGGSDRHAWNVLCAITERNLSTKVGAGENHGRELHHTAVVRQLSKVGSTKDGHFEGDVPLNLSRDWKPENLHAIVFLQHGSAGEIRGAAQIDLAPKK